MLAAKQMQSVKIDSLENGRERIEQIDRRSAELFREMCNTDAIPEWQKLNDERYELKKAKRHIQHQMGKIVAERHNV